MIENRTKILETDPIIPIPDTLIKLTLKIFDRNDKFVRRNHFAFNNGYTASLVRYQDNLFDDIDRKYFDYYEVAILKTENFELTDELAKLIGENYNRIRFTEEKETIDC
ncbi:hypothetical protein [Leptospira alexanderi]|uniref:Uncharacterized protein n=1 Tax=Leptospira alexanderi serovar Manhao 3 str. L 60 TaxID=1049759 RepID=V6HVV9_9LEPT|nr:hypothetical protein [Leptospira alexanderi]EQA61975.1 hypothetical protein LEP1GSC062_2046 [Leptospira alexanderi serovar Manhao 3 str. L 60]